MLHVGEERLPEDVEALKAIVLAERARVTERDQLIAQRDIQVAEQATMIASLEQRIYRLSKWAYGPRTEKSAEPYANAADQAWLPFAELLEEAQRMADHLGVHGTIDVDLPQEAPAKETAKRRSAFPEHYARVRTTIEVPEQERLCCGKPMEPMGVELSNKLERLEIAVVHEIARTKYCCRTCQMQVLTAPCPVQPLPKSLLGSNWLALLLVERFGNHMPYHRLEKKYQSEGLKLSRTVLCRSANDLGENFKEVHEALGEEVVSSDVAFADETSVKVQASKAGGPKRAWVWL